MPAPAPGTVATALWSDRSLVKTWAMRGTLHLLTTEDYPLGAAADLATREAERLAVYLGISADITVGGFVAGRGRKNP